MGLLYLVQWRHGPIRREEALVFRFVATAFQDTFILLYGYTVGVMKTFVNRAIDGSAKEIASALLGCQHVF